MASGPRSRARRGEQGQATVELVAALPALLLAGLIALQLLAAGYAATLADGAAEAGALSAATGGEAPEAARAALPGWAREDVAVGARDGRVTVRLEAPTVMAGIGDPVTVSSSATALSAR